MSLPSHPDGFRAVTSKKVCSQLSMTLILQSAANPQIVAPDTES
jgi:hypothetical protein